MSNTNPSIEDLLKKHQDTTNKGTGDLKKQSTTNKLTDKLSNIEKDNLEQEIQVKAQQSNLPYINLTGFPISPEALQIIPLKTCEKLKIICFLNISNQIRIGILDKTKEIEELAYQIGEQHHAETQLYLISENSFKRSFELYKKVPVYKKQTRGVQITEEELNKFKDIVKDFKKLDEAIKKTSITEMVTLIIAAATQAGSSDIHIEAEEKSIKVKFRVDGILVDSAEIEKKDWLKIISRIKLLAGLKLNITTKPQDGRFRIQLEKDKIDVRTSTLPTAYGESVVMRLLMSTATGLKFEDLGITKQAFETLQQQIIKPNGMIITTGPTGSGKTTTLYSILNKLNDGQKKIITLEDPIEYDLPGVNQSQIDRSKNYSFADGLKSSLRQDPDVIMVGEMRDLETADTAINASLTGHLVLSTIHTNSAAGAVPRFLAMGVKGFLLAPALNAIIGQRLVRRLCQKCKEKLELDEKTLEKVKKILEEIPADNPAKPKLSELNFFQSKGCEECNNLKYKGRIGIYEILLMNKEIEKIILDEKVSEYTIQEIAIKNGMLTMVQDGLIKASQGITSLEEVFRVAD